MRKLSNWIKVLLPLILVIIICKTGSVKGAENIEISYEESVQITYKDGIPEEEVYITKDMFDMTNTNWLYCYYNSDGIPEMGIIDKEFEGLLLEPTMVSFMCSPESGEATFYGSSLPADYFNVEEYYIRAVGCIDVDYSVDYNVFNQEDMTIYLMVEGDCKFNYSVTDGYTGEEDDAGNGTSLPTMLESYKNFDFSVARDGEFDVENPFVAKVYYSTGETYRIYVEGTKAEGYNEEITFEYNLDGTIYEIYNNANYDITIITNSQASFILESYYSDGSEYEIFENYVGQDTDCVIPAGGKLVINYEENMDEAITFRFYSMYESLLDVKLIKIPNEAIVESGTYRLEAGMGYYLGEGYWTVGTDGNIYMGGKTFYVKNSGDYQLTLQQ